MEQYCAACGSPTEERTVEGCLRPVCTACGQVVYLDPKLAVAVLIARDGRLLLGKRGPGTREPGKWSFPAGFVERGERVERAAAREAREETGLDVVIGESGRALLERGRNGRPRGLRGNLRGWGAACRRRPRGGRMVRRLGAARARVPARSTHPGRVVIYATEPELVNAGHAAASLDMERVSQEIERGLVDDFGDRRVREDADSDLFRCHL